MAPLRQVEGQALTDLIGGDGSVKAPPTDKDLVADPSLNTVIIPASGNTPEMAASTGMSMEDKAMIMGIASRMTRLEGDVAGLRRVWDDVQPILNATVSPDIINRITVHLAHIYASFNLAPPKEATISSDMIYDIPHVRRS